MAGWFDKARPMWQYCRTPRYDLIWDAIRVPVAFLVAPLGAPVTMGLAVLSDNPGSLFQHPEVLAIYVGVTGAAAYVITLLFGLPLFLILRKGRWTSFWIAPVAGCIVPFVALLIFLASPALLSGPPPPTSWVLLIALCGATVGTILWLIARPDRAAAPSSASARSS